MTHFLTDEQNSFFAVHGAALLPAWRCSMGTALRCRRPEGALRSLFGCPGADGITSDTHP